MKEREVSHWLYGMKFIMFWNLHRKRCLIIFTNNRELFGSGGKPIFPKEFKTYCGRWEMRQESVEIKRKCKAITAETELRELPFSFLSGPLFLISEWLLQSLLCARLSDSLTFPLGTNTLLLTFLAESRSKSRGPGRELTNGCFPFLSDWVEFCLAELLNPDTDLFESLESS